MFIRNQLNKFIAGFILLFLVPATYAELKATVDLSPTNIKAPVNRHILGQNIIGYKENRNADFVNRTGGGLWNPTSKTIDPSHELLIDRIGVSVLRWPGGGWAPSLKWQNLIGSLESRPKNTFGLPEFLLLCQKLGAKPLITLPTDNKRLKHIPDLIEYLNAPDDGSNPNGGVDWAHKRALDGQKEPWHVTWFEFGNETYGKNLDVHEYIKRYNTIYREIQQIDKTIKLGAVLDDSDNTQDGWSHSVISQLGNKIGFASIHPYYPTIKKNQSKHYSPETIALSALASDAPFEHRLNNYNQLILSETGRNDLPLAATEYNGLFVQEEPIPFRFSLVNAIHNADFIRIMLKPEYNIMLATHWNLLSSYWGLINKNKAKKLIRQANYHVYEIFNHYLGDQLIGMEINTPKYSFSGVGKIPARLGNKQSNSWKSYNGKIPSTWHMRWFSHVEQEQSNGIVTIKFKDQDVNYYHAYKQIKVKPDTLYRIRVKAKAIDLNGGKIGIAVEDSRGWNQTYNQPSNIQLTGTTPWQWLTAEIRTLPDAEKLNIMVRHIKGKGKLDGTVNFGELQVMENTSKLGNVDALVGTASVSSNGSRLMLILINKHISEPVITRIRGLKNYAPEKSETLTGSSAYSHNRTMNNINSVNIRKQKYKVTTNGDIIIELAPLSVTGIQFRL